MLKVRSALLLASLSISLTFALDICEHQANGVRLAHPADCNKFVICRNGLTAVMKTCPIGLHFNRFKGVCDLKERAACDIEFVELADREVDCTACCDVCGCNGSTPSTPEPPSPETPTPEPPCPGTPATPSPGTPATPTPGTPATPTPGTPTPGTPATPSPETPGPNCGNNITVCENKPNGSISYVNGTCNQYIVCSNGCAHIMQCPNNLQYNLNTHKCDFPENVDCPWTSKPPTTGPSGITCAQSGECAGKKDGTMLADPNSNGYIICQCECEIERPCPVGTKFDAQLKVCANPNSNNTGNGGNEGNGSNTGNGGNEGNGSNTGNGNNGSNTGNGGNDGNGNGSSNGNGSNGGNGNGNSTTAVTCVTGVCKEGDLLLPVDGECNKFYQCINDCAIEIICPNNLIYNPTSKQCDYPQNYNCPWPYTPPSGPSEGPSGIACASGGRCIDQPEGAYLPSLASKSKYVVCQCQCEVERDCPSNLVWDIEKSTCNWPNA